MNTTPINQRAELLRAIYAHARARWCWDDESFLEEMFDERWDEGDTPVSFVDDLADKYDLIDPHKITGVLIIRGWP